MEISILKNMNALTINMGKDKTQVSLKMQQLVNCEAAVKGGNRKNVLKYYFSKKKKIFKSKGFISQVSSVWHN